jgi:membrane fusion protein (multidrug efflux system)
MKSKAIVLSFIIVQLAILHACKEKGDASLPPPNVQVVEVLTKDVPIRQEFVGQVYGLFDISIRSRVEGFLEGIHFDEGRRVNKGQLLYTIDEQPFIAKVNGFKGQLAEANTRLVKAESDLARIEPLAEINAVSQSDLVAAVAQRDAAIAAVEAAEAALETAEIELGYCRIHSPISGVIGQTQAYPGDFVGRGFAEATLNDVSRIDTVRVNFHLPEELYIELVLPYIEGRDSIRVQRREEMTGLTMILADGTVYPHIGRILFINRQVDASTGTILLQAAFPNPSYMLRPGQFARIRAVIDVQGGAMLIPQRCVKELQGNYSVFVIGEDNKVVFREIEVAGSYGTSYFVVTSGLQAGDRVVYEGIQKIRTGLTVNPVVKELPAIESEI